MSIYLKCGPTHPDVQVYMPTSFVQFYRSLTVLAIIDLEMDATQAQKLFSVNHTGNTSEVSALTYLNVYVFNNNWNMHKYVKFHESFLKKIMSGHLSRKIDRIFSLDVASLKLVVEVVLHITKNQYLYKVFYKPVDHIQKM